MAVLIRNYRDILRNSHLPLPCSRTNTYSFTFPNLRVLLLMIFSHFPTLDKKSVKQHFHSHHFHFNHQKSHHLQSSFPLIIKYQLTICNMLQIASQIKYLPKPKLNILFACSQNLIMAYCKRLVICDVQIFGLHGYKQNQKGICGLSGLGYLYYFEYNKINKEIDSLMAKNELQPHLYQTNQQSAYSIDEIMDSFERRYNQFSINKYRQTLVGLCQGKVLQTCAGSNRNLKYYKPGTDLTLIDFSPNMISIGLAKVSPFIKYKYLLADAMNMPFKQDQFDCVIDTFGLEYTLNPHKALSEIRRVCKKGGKVILMNEGISSVVQFHYWQNMKWGYNLMKGGYFSNRNWQKLIKQFDFQIQHQQRKKNGKLYIFILKNSKDGKIQNQNVTQKLV